MSCVPDFLTRFLYRPDEPEGAYLRRAPEIEAVAEAVEREVEEEFLAFELEGQIHAIPIGSVREIQKLRDVTEVPRAPANVIGLINVRGEMLPLYDIKVRLHLAKTAPVVRSGHDVPRSARVVLIGHPEGDAGILVDGVLGVVKLGASRLEAASRLGLEPHVITGISRKGACLYVLIDLELALG